MCSTLCIISAKLENSNQIEIFIIDEYAKLILNDCYKILELELSGYHHLVAMGHTFTEKE